MERRVLSTIPNPKLVRRDVSVMRERSTGLRWWWIALPVLVALLVVFVVVLTLRNRELRETLTNNERQSTQQVTNLMNADRVLETMSVPDAIRITLAAPVNRQPTAQAVYQVDRGRLALVASNLAPLAPGHVYQLWLLPPKNGAPVPAGVFWPDERGHAAMFMAMPPNMLTTGFQVTIEAGGGSMFPTTKPIMVGRTQ